MTASIKKETSTIVEKLIICIEKNLLGWDDICALMNEHFTNGVIPDELQDCIDEVICDQDVEIFFVAESGWLYKAF